MHVSSNYIIQMYVVRVYENTIKEKVAWQNIHVNAFCYNQAILVSSIYL